MPTHMVIVDRVVRYLRWRHLEELRKLSFAIGQQPAHKVSFLRRNVGESAYEAQQIRLASRNRCRGKSGVDSHKND